MDEETYNQLIEMNDKEIEEYFEKEQDDWLGCS